MTQTHPKPTLKDLRLARGLSQVALARLCRMQQVSVSRIETGRNFPQPSTVLVLAGALTGGDTEAVISALQVARQRRARVARQGA